MTPSIIVLFCNNFLLLSWSILKRNVDKNRKTPLSHSTKRNYSIMFQTAAYFAKSKVNNDARSEKIVQVCVNAIVFHSSMRSSFIPQCDHLSFLSVLRFYHYKPVQEAMDYLHRMVGTYQKKVRADRRLTSSLAAKQSLGRY
jgi:hypothetical protein